MFSSSNFPPAAGKLSDDRMDTLEIPPLPVAEEEPSAAAAQEVLANPSQHSQQALYDAFAQ